MADEISREALLIYLDNIRTMETIVYESENALAQAQDDVMQDDFIQKNPTAQKPNEPFQKVPYNPFYDPLFKIGGFIGILASIGGVAFLILMKYF